MQGYIYLIGGGRVTHNETKEIDDFIKQDSTKKSPFVFFGSAANDSVEYANIMQSIFGSKFNVVIVTKKKGRKFAIDAINNASVIYLGGGKTELLIDLFEEWELVTVLDRAWKRGVNIAGMSAGAQALSAWYIDEDNNPMELRQGWGFVPACLLVHAKKENIEKARTLWQKHNNAKDYKFLAIGDRAAWRIGPTSEDEIGPGECREYHNVTPHTLKYSEKNT